MIDLLQGSQNVDADLALVCHTELEATFDATIAHLRHLNRSALLGHALQVGDFLLGTYFGGDLGNYHNRKSKGHVSFDALLQQRREALDDLGLSGQSLRNYILASSIWHELPDAVRGRLDLTHLHRLSVVKDSTVRARLAQDAADQGWPSRRLEAAIEAHRHAQQGPVKRGRPELPTSVKAWGQALAAVKKARAAEGGLAGLAGKQRQRVRQDIEAAIGELSAVLTELQD